MIKEYRIGNYINEPLNEDNKPFQIWGIYHEKGNNKINGFPATYFKPIPLTDEWKKKLSFKQFPYEPENLNEGYYWSLEIIKGIYLTIEEGDDYAYLEYGLDFKGTQKLIK